MLKRILKSSTAAAGVLLLGIALVAYAAQSYQVNSGATVKVDEHSTCRNVKNNNGSAIFVPTNSSGEWSAFQNNAPNVQLTGCDIHYWVALGSYADGPNYVTCSIYFSDGTSISASGDSGPPSYLYIGASSKATSLTYGPFLCNPGTEWEYFFTCPTASQCQYPTR